MTRLLPYCIGLLSILFPASMIADDVVIADEVAIAPQTAAVLADVLAAEIDLDDARAVEGLRLDTGFAQLRFHDGKLFPVRTPEGHVVEMVFIGRGSLVVELDDAIESSQLELFTGGEVLEETFTEAVFAVALDTASEALLSRPPAASGVLDSASRWAKHRSATWRDSQMRDLLSIDTAMTLDRLGDPFYGGYFGAWFKGDRVGEMLLSVQPEAVEQLTLGQFRPFDLQASDQGRKIEKELKKMQRKGRFVGLEIDELGSWDTWVSTPLRRDGEPHQGFAAFEPLHYRLAVDLDPDERTIHGTARIDLRPSVDGVRSAGLKLPETFQIDAVRDGAGNPLVYHRVDDDLRVFFPSPVDSDQTVEIAYHGMGLTEYKRAWVPHSNTSWYPRTGSVDRATYEIELSWPKRWTMLASGRLEDEGMRGDIRWQKRRLDRPGLAVSFTFGTFRVEELEVGHVDVTVAFDDSLVRWASGRRDVVTTAVKSSLSYFETIFGAYPDDELVIVTVPTFVSQALPGFIHLANVELTDELTSAGDRGTLIAHEISHQWWGNSVGWVGYRDQWLTEALANYSALLWARHGTDDETVVQRLPTFNWYRELTAVLTGGRTVESLGPVVLGERLASSKSYYSGYQPIVYKKGAMVIDMMSQLWREDVFIGFLGDFAQAAAGQVVSTDDFIAAIERLSGVPLDAFADRFIYGTGLPTVYYDYTFEPRADGRYNVRVVAEQDIPYRFAWSIVDTPRGLDIRRSRLDQIEERAAPMMVPFQVVLDLGDDEELHTLTGRLALDKVRTELAFDIEHPPRSFHLDARRQVFGRFYNRQQRPKQTNYQQGYDLAADGQLDRARELYEASLAAVTPPAADATRSDRRSLRKRDEVEDWRTHLELARLALDTDRLDDAEQHLKSARKLLPETLYVTFRHTQELGEARLALLRGDVDTAYDMLSDIIEDRGIRSSIETRLLWAIASWRRGSVAEAASMLLLLDNVEVDIEVLKEEVQGKTG